MESKTGPHFCLSGREWTPKVRKWPKGKMELGCGYGTFVKTPASVEWCLAETFSLREGLLSVLEVPTAARIESLKLTMGVVFSAHMDPS